MAALEEVILYVDAAEGVNSPPQHHAAARALSFFPVVLFKFSPCSALVIKSLRHKAGSVGSVYSFPKSIILHINHWSGTFGQC